MTVTPEAIEAGRQAYIDWQQSLEPRNGQTMFGAIYTAMSQASPPPQDEVDRALEMLDRRRSDAAASGGFCEIAIEEIDELRAALTAMKGTGDGEALSLHKAARHD